MIKQKENYMRKNRSGLLFSTCALLLMGVLAGCTNKTEDSSPVVVAKYTVNFIVDGASYETMEVEAGSALTLPTNPTKDGFTFTGWYTSELCQENEKVNAGYIVNANLTLYAGFEQNAPQTVTVTFDANGGTLSGNATVDVVAGAKVTKPANPTRDNYNFICWTVERDVRTSEFDFETLILDSLTLYAYWEEISYESKYAAIEASSSKVGHGPEAAADDNENTYWEAGAVGDATLAVDLGKVKSVTKVTQVFKDTAEWNLQILASIDNVTFVELASFSSENAKKFERAANGFYRYVKLIVKADETKAASSSSFDIEAKELSEGYNIAYRSKGVADCHAGGYEVEKMFDGNMSTLHIPNSDHVGHYTGFQTNQNFYYKNVELFMANETNYSFFIDYKDVNGGWPEPANGAGDYRENETASNYYKIDINDLGSAILYHQAAIGTNWHGIHEMVVNGFEPLTGTNELADGKDLYTFANLTYVNRIALNDHTSTQRSIEISKDGTTFTAIDLDNAEGNYFIVDECVKAVRYSGNGEIAKGSLSLYGINLVRNLAVHTNPTVDVPNGDAGYAPSMAILNPNCKDANGRMFCAPNYEQVEVMTIAFGNLVKVDNIIAKVQDNQTNETLKFKFEAKLADGTYVTLRDTTDAPISGQYVNVDEIAAANQMMTELRITFQILGTWTNLNTLIINGVGSVIA